MSFHRFVHAERTGNQVQKLPVYLGARNGAKHGCRASGAVSLSRSQANGCHSGHCRRCAAFSEACTRPAPPGGKIKFDAITCIKFYHRVEPNMDVKPYIIQLCLPSVPSSVSCASWRLFFTSAVSAPDGLLLPANPVPQDAAPEHSDGGTA